MRGSALGRKRIPVYGRDLTPGEDSKVDLCTGWQ